MVMVCRYHEKHSCCMKRLYVHPPRKPHNILSELQPDQLRPCQIQPRTFQPMKIGKNNKNLVMCIQNVSYAGADLFTIRTEPNFSRLSRMFERINLGGAG